MARRRSSNKLLGRILGISVAVHVVALPVLAHFGAFEKIRQRFFTGEITIPPPAPETAKPPARQAEKKRASSAAKSKDSAPKAARQQSNLTQPRVVSSSPGTGAGDAGPTVDPNGRGRPGVVPTPDGAAPGPSPEPTAAPVVEAPRASPKPLPTPNPEPSAKPSPTPAPRTPVFAPADPTFQPYPEIPDELRTEAMDAKATVLVDVDAAGVVRSVSLVVSCGNADLDRIAIDAARRWRFRAATRDGEPVPSKVRLHIRFKVD